MERPAHKLPGNTGGVCCDTPQRGAESSVSWGELAGYSTANRLVAKIDRRRSSSFFLTSKLNLLTKMLPQH